MSTTVTWVTIEGQIMFLHKNQNLITQVVNTRQHIQIRLKLSWAEINLILLVLCVARR